MKRTRLNPGHARLSVVLLVTFFLILATPVAVSAAVRGPSLLGAESTPHVAQRTLVEAGVWDWIREHGGDGASGGSGAACTETRNDAVATVRGTVDTETEGCSQAGGLGISVRFVVIGAGILLVLMVVGVAIFR
ncbi:hypothetical protein acdb102_22440 [Acidothermaceae bacterium B102]|nr:hypothetical protein acdb102_22440 [Acidothermaceae bacterium B102]